MIPVKSRFIIAAGIAARVASACGRRLVSPQGRS